MKRSELIIIVVLLIDAVLLATFDLFLLPLRFDGVALPDLGGAPFPITVVFAIVGNVMLTRTAARLRPRLRVGALPVFVWFVVTVWLTLGGPSGTFAVYPDWRILLLLAAGTLPAAVTLGRELGSLNREMAPGSSK